ncbi:MAG: trypsin-like serine protease [Pseudomonadota bacterium]
MRCTLFLLIVCLAGPASADLFAAAGRIEFRDASGGCSAALIEPDVIVTAAHCISEDEERSYVFRLGSQASIDPVPVTQIVVHPLYSDFRGQRLRRLRFDIAVARLSRPINPEIATRFSTGDEAQTGEGLFMASWRFGPRPRERRCLVIDTEVPGIVALGCSVRSGESGAPVLRMTETGVELVAVVNSTANYKGRSVAFASDVRGRIAPLIARLKHGP